MIKAVTKDGATKVMVSGDGETLCSDTCAIVHAVWSTIKKKDKAFGQAYEKFMREEFVALVFDEEPESKPEGDKQEQGDDEFVNAIVDAVIAAIMRSKS